MRPPAPLARVVERRRYRPARREGSNQQPKQDLRSSVRAPCGAVEHAMVVAEAALARAVSDPQDARHGAPIRGEDRTD